MLSLNKDKEFNFNLPSTHNTFVYLINGEIEIGSKIMIILKIVL